MPHSPRSFACTFAAAALGAGLIAACSPQSGDSIATDDAAPFDGIAADEVIKLSGTEPFWGISIEKDVATYSSPDNLAGSVFEVSRFAGNNGLGFSGKLDGADITITVTPGECSDAMSDRAYPFTATVKLGEDSLAGCGYTDKQGFTGDAMP
jgi:uncharacterized membrane protein